MDTSSVRCADQPNTEPLENRSLWARLQVSCSRPTLPACLLLALVFLAYLPALDAGFVFDDGMYLTENARMGSAEGLRRIWTEVIAGSYQHQYYPLTSSAFWLQHQLWGERPLGYHLVNVLLHAANAVLLWRLLRRLGVPGSWLVAAIFGVHPLNVQSVAWISELKNVLSTLFLLFSALVFVDWLRLDQQHEQEPSAVRRPDPHLLCGPPGREPSLPLKGGGLYALGLGLFVCALLSKTATCLLPVGLALIVWWKRGGMRRREVLGLGPLVLVGASFVAMTVYLESSYAGASGEAFSQTFLERFLVAGRAVWFYAGKLLWPGSLAVIYPRWEVDAGLWWQYVYPLGVVAVVIALWALRSRIGRGPLVAAVYFIAAVAPLSFVDVAFTRYSYVADHWAYWSSIGLICLVVAGVVGSHRWLLLRTALSPLPLSTFPVGPPGRGGERGAVLVCSVVVLATLSGLTWRRCAVFESGLTLWSDTLRKNPDAWAAHNNLGIALAAEGRLEDAIVHYDEALRLNPDFAEAHCNLGAAFETQGRIRDAITHFGAALRIVPDFDKAHYNMANVLRSQGELETAMEAYRRALTINPDYWQAHNNLGTALASRGMLEEAIAHYRLALRARPDYAEAHYNLGIALAEQGRLADAIAAYVRALELRPDYPEAYNNLGTAILATGRLEEAAECFRQALLLDADHAGAHYNLGAALMSLRRPDEAIDHYRSALDLDPSFVEAHNNLGMALWSRGDAPEAISHYRAALRINRDHTLAHFNLGLALDDRGEREEAIAHYRRVIEIDPEHARGHYKLGRLLGETGRPEESLPHLREAMRLAPDWPAPRELVEAQAQ